MNMRYAILAAGLLAAVVQAEDAKRLRFIFITTCVEEAFFQPVEKGMALLRRYGIRPASLDAGATILSAQDADRVGRWASEHYR